MWHVNPASGAQLRNCCALSSKNRPVLKCLCPGFQSARMCPVCRLVTGITAGEASVAINLYKPKERSELWRNGNRFNDFEAYEVSDFGRVRRSVPCAGSRVGKILNQTLYGTNNSYLYVGLSKNGKVFQRVTFGSKAFIPNLMNLPEVNHKGSKTNNRATKLEWRSKLGHAQDGSFRKQLRRWCKL